MKALVLFYSAYGHTYALAEAVADGVREVPGATAELRRVPETLPETLVKQLKIDQAQRPFAHIPVCRVEELGEADAVFFGTPTRYGNMCGQMRQFLDGTGRLWADNVLVGKLASVFTSSNNQHGGQETTIVSFHYTLLHLGMIIAGLPYSFAGQRRNDEITGGSPYGASTIAGEGGSRQPTANELDGARYQGRYVAGLAARLAGRQP